MSDCRGMSGLPVSVNLLLMLASLIAEIMAEEAYLLVGTGRGIERLELDGSGNTTILATPPGVGVIAMDYHHQHNMLFYSTDNLQIRRCSLTGENDQLLETNVESLGMVVDDANNKLYWGKAGPGEIWVSDVQDWWVTQNPISRLQLPYGITLDVKNGRMYFMENHAGAVKSTKLDGTNLVTLVEDESYGPTATMLSVRRTLVPGGSGRVRQAVWPGRERADDYRGEPGGPARSTGRLCRRESAGTGCDDAAAADAGGPARHTVKTQTLTNIRTSDHGDITRPAEPLVQNVRKCFQNPKLSVPESPGVSPQKAQVFHPRKPRCWTWLWPETSSQ